MARPNIMAMQPLELVAMLHAIYVITDIELMSAPFELAQQLSRPLRKRWNGLQSFNRKEAQS